jgi:calcium permeable stress-gated cation channel
VTTFTSGAAAVARKIAQDPTSLPLRLAQNLPKASNFYLTYFILQGTASAAKNVLNYWDLLEYLGYDTLFDKTPRAKYSRYTHMKGIRWGSVYPKFANMAIIGMYLLSWTIH